jgi:hypothetical protein
MLRRGWVNRITLKFCKNLAADQGPDDPARTQGIRVTLALMLDQPAHRGRVQ